MPDKLSIEPIGNKGPNMYIEPRNIIPIRKQTDRKKPDYNNVHEERFAVMHLWILKIFTILYHVKIALLQII